MATYTEGGETNLPYIAQTDRTRAEYEPLSVGELNYAITRLCDQYISRLGGVRYAAINDVIGVLECAKLEAYRRLAANYEDQKISENGEVWTQATDQSARGRCC